MPATLNNTGILYNDSTQQNTVAYTGFRNKIINGDFSIATTTTTHTTTSTAGTTNNYSSGRHFGTWIFASSNGNVTTSSNNNSWTQTLGTYYGSAQGPKAYLTVAPVSTNTGAGEAVLTQRIEAINCYSLISKTCTLSAYLGGYNPVAVNWYVFYANTKDTWNGTFNSTTGQNFWGANSGGTLIASGTWNPSTSPARFQASFTVPSNGQNGLQVVFTWTPNVTGNSNIFTGIQLEEGGSATPFEARDLNIEELLVQRYLPGHYISGLSSYAPVLPIGFCNTTTTATFIYPFKVTARKAPTGATYGPINYSFSYSGPVGASNSISYPPTFSSASNKGASLYNANGFAQLGGGAAFTQREAITMYTSTASAFFVFTGAEL